MADIIQIRRGSASQWTSTNPVLADGELGFETDTKKGKLGDGVTAWSSLPYSFTGDVTDDVATQITAATSKTTPVDADQFGITDSAASNVLKKLSWSNIKATLKTYFDTLYASVTHNQNASTILAGTFATGNFIFQENLEVRGQLFSPSNAKGNSGTGTVTFNWDDGNIQTVTLNGNCTFAFSNPQSGGVYQIIITRDATASRTITWPAAIKWGGGTAWQSAGANIIDIVTISYDGTTYFAVVTTDLKTV